MNVKGVQRITHSNQKVEHTQAHKTTFSPLTTGANIINYGLFAMIYGTQLLSE